jgi:hypothetical protein
MAARWQEEEEEEEKEEALASREEALVAGKAALQLSLNTLLAEQPPFSPSVTNSDRLCRQLPNKNQETAKRGREAAVTLEESAPAAAQAIGQSPSLLEASAAGCSALVGARAGGELISFL